LPVPFLPVVKSNSPIHYSFLFQIIHNPYKANPCLLAAGKNGCISNRNRLTVNRYGFIRVKNKTIPIGNRSVLNRYEAISNGNRSISNRY
jgi:hypothetical protein